MPFSKERDTQVDFSWRSFSGQNWRTPVSIGLITKECCPENRRDRNFPWRCTPSRVRPGKSAVRTPAKSRTTVARGAVQAFTRRPTARLVRNSLTTSRSGASGMALLYFYIQENALSDGLLGMSTNVRLE